MNLMIIIIIFKIFNENNGSKDNIETYIDLISKMKIRIFI